MPPDRTSRVLALSPLPPEKCAYALARYSRSPDSIRQSLEWVRTHDSTKFLEHFYFQYGHSSIADLGHLTLCFEGISELAAIEIEDEPLWDGQAKSSRYQDFSRGGFVTPPEFEPADASRYQAAASRLIESYGKVHAAAAAHLAERLPRPADMKPEVYQRNIAARAFDVARYLLFLGSHQCGPDHEHSHAREADSPLEGVRLRGAARDRRGDGRGLRFEPAAFGTNGAARASRAHAHPVGGTRQLCSGCAAGPGAVGRAESAGRGGARS